MYREKLIEAIKKNTPLKEIIQSDREVSMKHLTQNSETLLSGKYFLFSELTECIEYDCFVGENLNFYKVNVRSGDCIQLLEKEYEYLPLAIDVHKDGEVALLAYQFDDFPQVSIYKATTGELIDLDCGDLVDAQISRIRFTEALDTLLAHNLLNDKQTQFKININEKTLHWV